MQLDEHFKIALLDMRENGMCFHEGYLLGVLFSSLISQLKRMKDSNPSFRIRFVDDQGENIPTNDIIEEFEYFHATYSRKHNGCLFHYQLITFESERPNPPGYEVEIVCDRIGITDSDDPETAIRLSAKEFFRLHKVLNASALFLGPDTVQKPSLDRANDKNWMRVL